MKTILVTGATGRQGGAVIQHLVKNNFTVKALSRTPDSIPAQLLISRGVEVMKGELSNLKSLMSAMNGCDGVFSIQNYFECGGDKEVEYGKNLANVAKQCNISHFIYNSVCNADSNTGVPHFETKKN